MVNQELAVFLADGIKAMILRFEVMTERHANQFLILERWSKNPLKVLTFYSGMRGFYLFLHALVCSYMTFDLVLGLFLVSNDRGGRRIYSVLNQVDS